MPGQFAMPCDLPSIDSASPEALIPGKAAARAVAGPGFWTEWLSELSREGLLEALLCEDVIARALREAPTGHRYDSALDAKMTLICVLVACLFPEQGYDQVLAKAFGLPGLRFRRLHHQHREIESPRMGHHAEIFRAVLPTPAPSAQSKPSRPSATSVGDA